MIGAVLGGIGLFLLGMTLLTDGLQTAAGSALRTALRRYTKTTLSSVTVGAATTALVQSSSATTLATIGFVGAGLLPFSSALGIVYGANVGTTATAWIVSAVGLKIKMTTFALPLVGVGALAKLFTRGRRSAVGQALAGFGLIFVGIDVLQRGMQDLGSQIDPSRFATEGVAGMALLVLIGIVTTVVMQSSSAAVATTLTALSAGTIDLEQAAALVIGQNVGTTVTAAIGAAGGSAPMRRTAVAHVAFNVASGGVALLLLPVFFRIAGPGIGRTDPAIAIAAFHTSFNVAGVLLFAPFAGRFAEVLERVVKEKGAALTRRLNTGRIGLASAALEAIRYTARDIEAEALRTSTQVVDRTLTAEDVLKRTEILRSALDACRARLAEVRTDPATPAEYGQHVGNLHAVDHLYRLVEALEESDNARRFAESRPHTGAADLLMPAFCDAIEILESAAGAPTAILEDASRQMAELRRAHRPRLLEQAVRGEVDAETAEQNVEAMRWIDRIAYHAWRAAHHLDLGTPGAPLPEPPAPESIGRRSEESYDLR